MVRPSVHSTKHYVQQSIGTSVPGTPTSVKIAASVDVAAKDLVNEVEEGSQIKAIYIEMWVRSAATAAASFTFCINKSSTTIASPTVAQLAALGDWSNKKNVLYVCQGLTNDVDSTALSVFRAWLKIPKGKQRMGLGDQFEWNLSAIGQSVNFCGFQTYKEYT